MNRKNTDLVTGAFGFTGKYIAERLLAKGRNVRTLSNHPDLEAAKAKQIQCFEYRFENPDKLVDAFQGVDTFYNTYWVRFNYGEVTFDDAVKNTLLLINAARKAGVRKIVHVSITQPDKNSSLPYFRGKGFLEEAVKNSGLEYTILRPALVFGKEDILIGNIAWFVRRLPIAPVFGDGNYLVQPTFVEDLAQVAVEQGQLEGNSATLDVVGPEIYRYCDLVKVIAAALGRKPLLVRIPAALGVWALKLFGIVLGDVILTKEEVRGLMEGRLFSTEQPRGTTAISKWLQENSAELGMKYESEVKRHFDNNKKFVCNG